MGFKVKINSNRIKFSSCHFLKEPRKCSRLHGHNYYVSVEVESDLDENYFVEDFIQLKKNVEAVIEPLDHYILIAEEASYLQIQKNDQSVRVDTSSKSYVFPRSEVVFLPLPATTSELLAKYIHTKIKNIYQNKKVTVNLEESKDTIAIFSD